MPAEDVKHRRCSRDLENIYKSSKILSFFREWKDGEGEVARGDCCYNCLMERSWDIGNVFQKRKYRVGGHSTSIIGQKTTYRWSCVTEKKEQELNWLLPLSLTIPVHWVRQKEDIVFYDSGSSDGPLRSTLLLRNQRFNQGKTIFYGNLLENFSLLRREVNPRSLCILCVPRIYARQTVRCLGSGSYSLLVSLVIHSSSIPALRLLNTFFWAHFQSLIFPVGTVYFLLLPLSHSNLYFWFMLWRTEGKLLLW